MNRALTPEQIEAILESTDIGELSMSDIAERFRRENGMAAAAPDGLWACDPRTGTLVVFNPARARRPHDWSAAPEKAESAKPCPICEGKTTGILDVHPLSEGVTFINKNLFPCFYPHTGGTAAPQTVVPGKGAPANIATSNTASGLHFLQWTSSVHRRDWHNLPPEDAAIVLRRLAALEHKLLTESEGLMPETTEYNPGCRTFGFVSIIKNYGAPVGGSLAHGHQQIVHSNLMPAALHNDREFLLRTGQSFAAHLQGETPASLVVRDLGAARLLVPYYMKRPYQSVAVPSDTRKRFLFELTDAELSSLAALWCDAVRAMVEILPRLGKDAAYNVLIHNGPSGGLYIEFLPYSQETGGYERLGLYVCHETPEVAAETLRRFFQIQAPKSAPAHGVPTPQVSSK